MKRSPLGLSDGTDAALGCPRAEGVLNIGADQHIVALPVDHFTKSCFHECIHVDDTDADRVATMPSVVRAGDLTDNVMYLRQVR